MAVKCSQFQTRSHILSLWQDSQNYPKLLGQIAQASIFVVHSAANNLPDDIWPDLEQQITSYFQILLDPCRGRGSLLPLCLSLSEQVSLRWQSLIKGSGAPLTCSSEHWADTRAVGRPTHNVPFCSKKQMHGKRDAEAAYHRERETSIRQQWVGHFNPIKMH